MTGMPFQEIDPRDLVMGNAAGELSLIGEILLDPQSIDNIAERVRPQDFVDPLLGRVFALITARSAAGQAVTHISVVPFMRDDQDFADRGGAELLTKAFVKAVGHPHGEIYADQIAALATRRKLIEGLRQGIESASGLENDDAAVASKIEGSLASFVEKHEEVVQHSASDCVDAVEASFDRPRRGVKCGIIGPLDEGVGPIVKGEMIVLAGRPGMGKTATALTYLWGAANMGHASLFISAEMDWESLSGRLVCDFCCTPQQAIPYNVFVRGDPSPEQRRIIRDARDNIARLPFKIVDRQCGTLVQIRRAVRRRKRELEAAGKTLDLVVVDYLQLITADDSKANEYENVTKVSRGLKMMAKDEGVAMIALSQLNRGVEGRLEKRPVMADLRQSGQIEQDADGIVFLLSPEYYLLSTEPDEQDIEKHDIWRNELERVRHRLEFIVAKRRSGTVGVKVGKFFRETQAVRGFDFFENGGR